MYIESWNEYDEGSGIYAANAGPAYIRPGSAAERLGSTDTWSATNDPYQYIRATANGARQFNETPDRDATIVAEDMPLELMPGETRTVTLVLRNEGDLSWTGAAGYGFAQHTEGGQTPFVAGGAVAIDDARYEIPTYGGVFRGRPITVQFQVTAPEAGGTYATSWQMRQRIVPPEYRNDRVLNWHGNTEGNPSGEQAPGLVTAVDTSPGLSGDSPMDAFGAVGGIEPETFIFRDNGTVDNGNQTLGDGGETVDYVHFTTSAPVTLDGYSLWLPTDEGQQNAYRSTALVQLTIDDVVVDFFDNDGRNGTQVRSFVDGPVTGQDFRIDLTRVTTGGPRIGEIDAILAKGFEPRHHRMVRRDVAREHLRRARAGRVGAGNGARAPDCLATAPGGTSLRDEGRGEEANVVRVRRGHRTRFQPLSEDRRIISCRIVAFRSAKVAVFRSAKAARIVAFRSAKVAFFRAAKGNTRFRANSTPLPLLIHQFSLVDSVLSEEIKSPITHGEHLSCRQIILGFTAVGRMRTSRAAIF